MPKFSLEELNNCLEPNKTCSIRYKITCDLADYKVGIAKVEVNITGLADSINWTDVKGSMEGSRCNTSPAGMINFIFDQDQIVSFKERPEFIFTIDGINLKSGSALSGPVEITFSLSSVLGKIKNAEYGPGKIVILKSMPVINRFKLNPSIVTELGKMVLSLDCVNIDSCKIINENGTTIASNLLPKIKADKTCKGEIPGVKVYEHIKDTSSLYLQAKSGDAIATENSVRTVTIFKKSGWERTALVEKVIDPDTPGNDRFDDKGEIKRTMATVEEESTIIDLVQNEYDDKIWAFAKGREPGDLIYLWCSDDGLKWFPYKTSSKDSDGNVQYKKVVIPPDVVHCPAVHFNGKLYFVCGSKVDIHIHSNTLKELDYASKSYSPNRPLPVIPGGMDMESRSLHGCVIFPFDGNDNIWVIGGTDKHGNGLRDIRRWDGLSWHTVGTPSNFPKRCRFGATVQTDTDGKKKAIWIAGGAGSDQGDTINDVWAYGLSWAPISWVNIRKVAGGIASPLTYTGSWLNASALTAIPVSVAQHKSGALITAIDFFEDAGNEEIEYRWIKEGPTAETTDTHETVHSYGFSLINRSISPAMWFDAVSGTDNYTLATIGFNGCIWMMAIIYKRKGNILLSDLFYSCPL